ncbi:EF-hand domain-containing protein [Roseinatronobacter sp.]|uniref:EF-hand domain-containing protein n=1 Tax=Roseinatronobacter sp. TaxID=1945755 RepID=UPI0025EDF62D|nr:EF-hand domain-containing protein [Rhodobaca sp.]
MKKQFAIAASVMALAATPLLADMHEDAEHEFPLTMDEFMEAYPEVAPEQFMLIDTDGDGQVSEEEYDSAREAGIIGGEDDI